MLASVPMFLGNRSGVKSLGKHYRVYMSPLKERKKLNRIYTSHQPFGNINIEQQPAFFFFFNEWFPVDIFS